MQNPCFRAPWLAAGLLALWLWPGAGQALEIRDGGHLWIDDQSLLVRLHLNLKLPPILEEALTNGVTLEFETVARLEQDRWLGRNNLQQDTRRVKLQYFALNRHYLVTAVDEERMELKPTLGDALETVAQRLGRIPLRELPADLRERPDTHHLAARLHLVYTALPLPLQLNAGLRGDLTTRREWVRWPLD